MKLPDKSIADNLLIAGQMLAQMSEQFAADVAQLDEKKVVYLKKLVKCWYRKVEEQRQIVGERLLEFGVDPKYQIGEVASTDAIGDILERAEQLVTAAHQKFCEYRKAAWNIVADYTPDIYEHAIRKLEKILGDVENEQELLEAYGDKGYLQLCLTRSY